MRGFCLMHALHKLGTCHSDWGVYASIIGICGEKRQFFAGFLV